MGAVSGLAPGPHCLRRGESQVVCARPGGPGPLVGTGSVAPELSVSLVLNRLRSLSADSPRPRQASGDLAGRHAVPGVLGGPDMTGFDYLCENTRRERNSPPYIHNVYMQTTCVCTQACHTHGNAILPKGMVHY